MGIDFSRFAQRGGDCEFRGADHERVGVPVAIGGWRTEVWRFVATRRETGYWGPRVGPDVTLWASDTPGSIGLLGMVGNVVAVQSELLERPSFAFLASARAIYGAEGGHGARLLAVVLEDCRSIDEPPHSGTSHPAVPGLDRGTPKKADSEFDRQLDFFFPGMKKKS